MIECNLKDYIDTRNSFLHFLQFVLSSSDENLIKARIFRTKEKGKVTWSLGSMWDNEMMDIPRIKILFAVI